MMKVIRAFAEVITIVLGTYIFVVSILNSDSYGNEEAGIGASLVVLGLLIKTWRKDWSSSPQSKNDNDTMKSTGYRNLVLGVLIVLSLTLWRRHAVSMYDIRRDIGRLDVEVQNVEYNLLEALKNKPNNKTKGFGSKGFGSKGFGSKGFGSK